MLKDVHTYADIPYTISDRSKIFISDVPASGVYFLTYEYLKEQLKDDKDASKFGLLQTIFAGGMAGILNWVVAMPADVLKSRLQTGKSSSW